MRPPRPNMLLLEKLGDRPEWMRIKKYRAEGRRAELVLSLGKWNKKRDYWFPTTPAVYERFKSKIQESRSTGLKYLQRYIRMYRGYAGIWPHRGYVHYNQLEGKSYQPKVDSPFTSQVMELFDKGHSLPEISEATDLPLRLVETMLSVYAKSPMPDKP